MYAAVTKAMIHPYPACTESYICRHVGYDYMYNVHYNKQNMLGRAR